MASSPATEQAGGLVARIEAKLSWRAVALFVAAALWLISVVRIDASELGGLGLVGVLPITFFVAIGILLVSFASELYSHKPSQALLALHVVLLVFVIHGTVPLVFPEARFPWSYKHFGVTDHIDTLGTVSPTVDIYQNWPGFFAFGSFLDQIGGVDGAIEYGKWSQVFFNLIYVLELAFVYRTLTSSKKVIWTGLVVFVSASWVGQDYYAPQAFVFVLVLASFGLLLRWLVYPEPNEWLSKYVNRFVPASKKRQPDDVPALDSSPSQRYWAVIGTGFLFFVLTFSHQLTPYLMLAGIAMLLAFGALRSRTVLFLLGAIAVCYLLPHLSFVIDKYGLLSGFDPLGNAKNQSVSTAQGDPGRILAGQCARALSGLVWLLAVVGLVRRLFHGRREVVAAALMVAPFAIVVGQSYGGEAIYRVYLFSLPWAAYLVAQAIVPLGKSYIQVRAYRTVIPLVALFALLMPAYYGLEEVNEVRPGEVAASHWFYDNAEPGSVLMAIEPNFPLKSKGNYDQMKDPISGDITTAFKNYPELLNAETSTADLQKLVEEQVPKNAGTQTFLVLSEGQAQYSKAYGNLRPSAIPELGAALDTAPKWKVALRNEDAVIYQFVG